ncbi:MAG TPA: OsmC family peroxiredoxin [Candidatus Limnocylindria bacterium]|nr:OsmC family peroxiredoxin [Candidatus Limnocylindria bacterium]
MEATRSATTIWQGDLLTGTGEVSSATSEHLRGVPVSWASRTEDPQGRSSPEELLAAAHSACFSMAMSGRLAKAGHVAERLEVRADVTFEKREAGWAVAGSRLTVRGRVPGADEATFQEAAEGARDGCPISQALKGNVEISVEAVLEA